MSQLLHYLRTRLGPTLYQIEMVQRTTQTATRSMSSVQRSTEESKLPAPQVKPKAPLKFTSSEAYLNYRATDNFYGGDDRDLPPSHNAVLAGSGILAFYYLIFLRDDIDGDGGKELLKPLHESVPELAIPIIQAAIAENKKLGHNTQKLEKKLEELMKEPDKHGGGGHKLIEN